MSEPVETPPSTPAAPPRRERKWPRRVAIGVSSVALLLVAALATFWQWSGSDGSLARALGWGQTYLPPGALTVDGLSGALRRGGEARHIRWTQGGLSVDVYDAQYKWNPLALLKGQIHFSELSARHIIVDDQRAPSTEPSGPPTALGLPLGVQIDSIKAGKLEVVNPKVFAATEVDGRYQFDGANHRAHLETATVEQGTYQVDVRLGTVGAPDIDARLTGHLLLPPLAAAEESSPERRASDSKAQVKTKDHASTTNPEPKADAGVPLSVDVQVRGPLTDMKAQAKIHGTPASSGAAAAQLEASARITPWEPQPLPEAEANFSNLDVAPFWSAGPQTLLTGNLSVHPHDSGWQIAGKIDNALPGPWDRHRLPLNALDLEALWQDGVVTVQKLLAELAGGRLQTTGSWKAPSTSEKTDLGIWLLETDLSNINPAQLHTQLAPFPLDGQARVSGRGSSIDFDAQVQARNTRGIAPSPSANSKSSAQAAQRKLAQDLASLHLQTASAKGVWNDGVLKLGRLLVRSTDAELTGADVELQTKALSGKGRLQLSAPGALVKFDGSVGERAGGGTLQTEVSDMARLLSWVQTLPGVPSELSTAQASGRLSLQGAWQGGWADPGIKLQADIPQAQWMADKRDKAALPLKLEGTSVSLNGRLAAAQLDGSGTLKQGERTLKFRANAEGGRSRAGTSLASSSWSGVVKRLELTAFDPALSQGRADAPWRINSRAPVSLAWTPLPGASGGGEFRSSAGELTLTAPTRNASDSTATIAWQPNVWKAGTLTTSGRVSGLPLAWVELFSGPDSQDSSASGDLLFDGQWNAQLGSSMQIDAELSRTRGDLVITTKDSDTGVVSRVTAGIKEARLQLRSQGQAVTLRANWNTEQLGVVTGEVRSQLSASKDTEGNTSWSWPETAPVSGEIHAALPRIATWSRLAPPGWRLKGSLGADVKLAGTRGTPLFSGTLSADDLALRSIVEGIEFNSGKLRARLDGQRLVVDEFSLRGGGGTANQGAGGGSMKARGEATLSGGQVRANLMATLDHLHASLRTDRLVILSGQIQASMMGKEATLDGKLRIDRARISLPEESAPSLGSDVVVRGAQNRAGTNKALPSEQAELKKQAREQQPKKDGLTLKSDIQVDLGEDFRLKGQGIDTRLAGQLQATTTGPVGSMPRVAGAVHTVGGTFRAYSQQLNIETGEIRFTGDPTNPTLNVLALRPNYQSDQRVGVQITGSALLPRIRLYAQPDLPDGEKLAWLMLGRAAPSSGAESAMVQQAALALIGGRDGKSMASRFGLDELSFSGGGDTDTGTTGASLTFGKRLSEKLYATYEHSLGGAMGTVFIYYELSTRWLLRGQAGGRSALDLIYTLSFD